MRVPAPPRPKRLGAFGGGLAILALALSGSLAAACTAEADPSPATAAPAAGASDPGMTVPTPAEVETAWAGRPDYVRHAHPMVEAAYRYALERPDVVRWMPCYCGCGAMEHRSNLDCFFRTRIAGAVAFEEHASYCDICIETALLAKQRLAEGRTLAEVRAEVDERWGGNGVPGTPTDLPQG